MANERRLDDESGRRLDQLEKRFQLIDERLARIEVRMGIAPETPAPSASIGAKTAERKSAPEELVPAHQISPTEVPIVSEHAGGTRRESGPSVKAVDQGQNGHQESQDQKPTKVPRRSYSFNDLEERLTGRLLAWVGGLALIVGAIFFLSLAFSRGWIGPTARVIIGLIVGAALVAAGAWFFERGDRLFGHVLTPVGLGILSLSFFAGTQLYDLVPIELGLVGALVASVAAATIAIRANSQLIAAYGLITALSAPIVLQASPSASTIAFLSIALVGTTIVALYRTWSWLPAIAFLLAVPQVSDYVSGHVSIAAGMTAIGAFWLLNAVAAGGEEFRVNRGRLGITSTTLLVANAAFAVGWGFYLLQGDADWSRGLFLVCLAMAHFILGGYFLLRRGDHHPFGMLAFGTGIASASMALPVALGGPVVPIGWAAEAAALAWVYSYRKHGYSGLMSLALGSMAIGHLVLFEYPIRHIDQDLSSHLPFLNANGGTLAFILAALAVSGFFVRRWNVAIPSAALGSILVIYALPFETSGLLLVGLWAALFVLLTGVDQRLLGPRVEPVLASINVVRFAALDAVLIAGFLAAAAAVLHVFSMELSTNDLGVVALPSTPFWDRGTAAAVILIVASLAAGWLSPRTNSRRAAATAAIGMATYLLPFELRSAAIVVGWSILAAIAIALVRFDQPASSLYGTIGAVLIGLGSLRVLVDVAPLSRLGVSASRAIAHPLFWSGATASVGSIVIVLALGAWMFRTRRIEPALWLLAAVGVVYILSIGVIDDFQGRLGGATALEELQKQAQVALSILWAVLGGVALVAGLWRGVAVARGAGLALLGVVSAKVFFYDLSSLDAAYRVLSFIGLGVLLLLSAYLYQHIGPHDRKPAAT